MRLRLRGGGGANRVLIIELSSFDFEDCFELG